MKDIASKNRLAVSILAGAALLFGSVSPTLVDGRTNTVQLFEQGHASSSSLERTDENGRVYAVTQPSFTVYPADPLRNRGTAIIICPGGGYYLLDMRSHVELVAPILNQAGITVFGLKYRLWCPSTNAPLEALADIQQAVRVIRSRAAEWGVNPHRLGVQGYSAGSHLALSLLQANDTGTPDSKDPLAKVSTLPDFAILMCPSSPANIHLPKNTPPTYITHAEDDNIVPVATARNLKQQLDDLGVPAHLRIVPCGGHNAFNFLQSTGKPEVPWTDEVVAWLHAQKLL